MASAIPKTRVRQATPKDLDALTDLFFTCIATDEVLQNRYRFRRDFPDDHEKFTRLYMELVLSGDYPDYLTRVLEVEEGKEERGGEGDGSRERGTGRWKIAAMAIWDVVYVNRRVFKNRGETYVAPSPNPAMEAAGSKSRRDKDPTYEAEFVKHAIEARNEFEDLFAGDDMYLSMLATYPWCRRRGYATELVRWGVNRSERDGVPVSLVSSRMGEGLYRECGFMELGRAEVVVEVKECEDEGGEEGVGEGRGEKGHIYMREVLIRMVYRPGTPGIE